MIRFLGFAAVLMSGSFACDGNDDGNDDGSSPSGTGASPTTGQSGSSSQGSGAPDGTSGMSGAGAGVGSQDGTDDATTDETQTTGRQEDCDPSGCDDYCTWGRCLFDGDIDGSMCLAACTTQCGNVFFDDVDQSLLTCQLTVNNDFSCEDTQACCDEFFVNEICP